MVYQPANVCDELQSVPIISCLFVSLSPLSAANSFHRNLLLLPRPRAQPVTPISSKKSDACRFRAAAAARGASKGLRLLCGPSHACLRFSASAAHIPTLCFRYSRIPHGTFCMVKRFRGLCQSTLRRRRPCGERASRYVAICTARRSLPAHIVQLTSPLFSLFLALLCDCGPMRALADGGRLSSSMCDCMHTSDMACTRILHSSCTTIPHPQCGGSGARSHHG
jgi:hypothetical protein